MKREIKFRAWDNEKKQMYEPTFEAYKGNLFELFLNFRGGLCAHTMEGMEHESLFPERFMLMQFTGLLDKNGKEWYEGDIVKMKQGEQENKESAIECFGVIHFHAGAFYINIKDGFRTTIYLHEIDGNFEHNWHSPGPLASRRGWYYVAFDIENIGNVFENTDLLPSNPQPKEK